MRELSSRTAARVARVRGKRGDPAAAGRRLAAIGDAYLEFARTEPGLFATAFVDAGVLDAKSRAGAEYPIWSAVHGLAMLTGQGPLRDTPETTQRHIRQLTFAFIGRALT